MALKSLSLVASFFSLLSVVAAGDDKWLSPEYKEIFKNPLPIPPVKTPKYSYTNASSDVPIDYYEIEIKPFSQQVYAGKKPAQLIGYDGISPGPTFMMEKGREAVVRFINKSVRKSAIHLHGSYSRAPFDGWAEDTIAPNEYKDYYYPNHQSARTLWYHDHAVHITAQNAYFGQAGLYLLHDKNEDILGLPKGKYDVPLVLSSKQYNSDGTLFDPIVETVSLYGDVIHVNGQPWPFLAVEPRKYRFRLLDAAISRTFQLYLQSVTTGKKVNFQVIASDTGLISKPITTDNLYISMAERWEIVIDFAAFKGQSIDLMNMRDVGADEDYAATDKVMRFNVGNTVTDTTNNAAVPSSLATLPFPPNKSNVDRSFKFERSNGEWQINGVIFSDVNNRILAKPQRGAVEVWELENSSGGWSHPIHIHLVDFRVISRTDGKRTVQPYEAEALKDVVWLGPNEKVKVLARYAPWDGVYMFHCHNLIHEDHDMMAAFNVTSLPDWGYNETTKFLDPMEERWRAKPYPPPVPSTSTAQTETMKTLKMFSELDAYSKVKEVEQKLEEYWADKEKNLSRRGADVKSRVERRRRRGMLPGR
ncbi:hypothetical protein FKW77_005223 [Venturia effusa]|uniref:Bilirubin oxidase n=1 Tax=Venturia effusa TaxID=50376 RepID=A0A517LK76_9PEZI|nr:hypothetical protein FKW77_005223 [Venturia effusa]